VLSGISLSVAIGFGVVAPVLPMFAASFGVNEMAAGAVISAFALMRLVFAPAVGRLDDRLGHRAVLTSGILIVAVSSVLTGFAQNYPQLIILRGLGGVGSAMFSVAGMTVLLASVDAAHRGRASGLYQGGFLVGAVIGPAIGGLFGGISLRAPFFFYAGTLAVAATVGLFLTPVAVAGRGREGAPGAGQHRRPLSQVLRDWRFIAACGANLTQGWNSNGTRSTLVPLFIAGYLAGSEEQASLWTGVAMAVAAAVQIAVVMPAGWAVDRYGRRVPMVAGALVAGAALAFFPWSGAIVPLTALMCVYAVGSALLGTAPSAAVGDAAGPGGDRAIAIYSMAGDTGSVVGPLVAGFLAQHVSYPVAFAVGAVLWFGSAGLSSRLPTTHGGAAGQS
jgi:MFS family permease